MRTSPSRRTLLQAAIPALGVVVAGCTQSPADAGAAPASRPKSSPVRLPYERQIATSVDARVTIESPHLGNVDLYLLTARNWMRTMVTDYHYDAGDLRVVFANHGPMNFITYNDAMWTRYRVGEWQHVTDDRTGQPSVRNLWASQVADLQSQRCTFLA